MPKKLGGSKGYLGLSENQGKRGLQNAPRFRVFEKTMEKLFPFRKDEHGKKIAQGVGNLLFFQVFQKDRRSSPSLQKGLKIFVGSVGVPGASKGETAVGYQ